MELFEMVQDNEGDARSNKKPIYNKKGFKRALVLLTILMILVILHTIIQRLSDSNINVLFNKLFNEMQNISKIGRNK